MAMNQRCLGHPASLPVVYREYGASSSLWEVDSSDFSQVGPSPSLGFSGVLSEVADTSQKAADRKALGCDLEVGRGNCTMC